MVKDLKNNKMINLLYQQKLLGPFFIAVDQAQKGAKLKKDVFNAKNFLQLCYNASQQKKISN